MCDTLSQEGSDEEDERNAIIRNLEMELEGDKKYVGSVTRPSGYKLDGLTMENCKHVLLVLYLYLNGKVSELRLASMASPEVLMKLARQHYINEVNKWNEEMKIKKEEKEQLLNTVSRGKGFSITKRLHASMSVRGKVLNKIKRRAVGKSDSSLNSKDTESIILPQPPHPTTPDHKASTHGFPRIDPQNDFKTFEEFLNHIKLTNKEESARMKKDEEESEKLLREKGEWMRKIADAKLLLNELQLLKEDEKVKSIYLEKVSRKYDRHGNLITSAEELQSLENREKVMRDNYFDAVHSYVCCSAQYQSLVSEMAEEKDLLQFSYDEYLSERANQLQSKIVDFDKNSKNIKNSLAKPKLSMNKRE